MEKITKLIQSLSPREIRLYYKYAELSGKKRNNLKIKLFEIARKNPKISDIEAANLLGKQNNAAFSMLKSRLQDDLIKLLIFDGDEQRFFSKNIKSRYQALKLIAASYVMDNRGLISIASEAVNKAERLAKRYELSSLLVVINEHILISRSSSGPQTYSKFKSNVFKGYEQQIEQIKAQDLLKQITSPHLFLANKSKSKIEIAETSSRSLEEIYKKNQSGRIQFYYLRSLIELTELKHEFDTQLKHALQLLDLVKNTDSVRSSDNIGGAHMLISLACLHLRNYPLAAEHATLAADYFFKLSPNELMQKTLYFHSIIGNNSINEAEELVKSVREYRSLKRGSFSYSRWLYYDANIKFLNKDYKGALNLLNRHSFLKSDRSGWRLGYKILEMMCIVELHHYDWLPYRLETFRKLLSDIKKESTARPKLIQKLLNRLVKENFDFDATTNKMWAEFDMLRSNSGEYYCYPLGYEVIRFDVWWAGKLKHAPGEGPAQKKRKRNAKA